MVSFAPGRAPVDLPAVTGAVLVDSASCAAVADDFGHVVRRVPRAVVRPGCVDDVTSMMRFAHEHRIPVAPRGQGHTTGGQSQVSDGICLDMRSLAEAHVVRPDRVVVQAGARWNSVVAATLRHGLTPPVLTDYLDLTVGGTLAVGGIGGASHRHGVQADHVIELQVVTGTGELRTCSPERDRELFRATLAGLGQCAVIVTATVRLVPARPHARFYLLPYPDLRSLTADQRRLATDRRFDHIEGHARLDEDGRWQWVLGAATFHSPDRPPDDAGLLTDLAYRRGAEQITDMSYEAFLDRLTPYAQHLRSTGEWADAHPWWGGFLPDSVTDDFVGTMLDTLTGADIGASGSVLLFPVPTDTTATPLLRLPEQPLAFHFAVHRTARRTDTARLTSMATDNIACYARMRSVGGMDYPVGSVAPSVDDWVTFYGPAWTEFAKAKDRYDPHQVLTPGPGIFRTHTRAD